MWAVPDVLLENTAQRSRDSPLTSNQPSDPTQQPKAHLKPIYFQRSEKATRTIYLTELI